MSDLRYLDKKNVHEEVTMEQSSINHLIRFSFTDWHFIGVMVFEPDNCETRYIKKCVKEKRLNTLIIWRAILRFSLANFWSGFYSPDHCHRNGPFVYYFFFFRSQEIQNGMKHKK